MVQCWLEVGVSLSKNQIINIIAPGWFVNGRSMCGRVDSTTAGSVCRFLFTRPSTGQLGPVRYSTGSVLGQYWVSTGSVLDQYWKDADVLKTCWVFKNDYKILYFFGFNSYLFLIKLVFFRPVLKTCWSTENMLVRKLTEEMVGFAGTSTLGTICLHKRTRSCRWCFTHSYLTIS